MKVYVTIQGVYESAYPSGVYTSVALAIADNPDGKWTEHRGPDAATIPAKYRYLYPGEPRVSWSNSLDWSQHVEILEFDLVESGPERQPDERIQQVYRESDGGWDYVPVEDALPR